MKRVEKSEKAKEKQTRALTYMNVINSLLDYISINEEGGLQAAFPYKLL
jgi:hypothetical protein